MEFFVEEISKNIPKTVTIVAATKYFTSSEMRTLFDTGIHHFGENRVEPFLDKINDLSDLNITWHIIGTLQTKKVKKIIDKVDYLHSLDNINLALEINKRRLVPLKCFIQVNISDEESKHGLNMDQVVPFIQEIKDLKNIELVGFMGMAEHTDDEKVIGASFEKLNHLQTIVLNECGMMLKELSIGMSNDYLIALKYNATMLRLGSVLFKKGE